MDLAETEHAVWMRSATMSRTALIVLGAITVAAVALVVAVTFIVLRDEGYVPVSLVIGLIAAVVILPLTVISSVRFTITIDGSGITARSATNLPKIHVPASQITSAQLVEVSPMAEFGGWGWRLGGNGTGIVMRAGEGIRISREGKSDLTITVDDAETAVALLRRTMERAR